MVRHCYVFVNVEEDISRLLPISPRVGGRWRVNELLGILHFLSLFGLIYKPTK